MCSTVCYGWELGALLGDRRLVPCGCPARAGVVGCRPKPGGMMAVLGAAVPMAVQGSGAGRGTPSLPGTGVAVRLASLTVVLVATRIRQLRGVFGPVGRLRHSAGPELAVVRRQSGFAVPLGSGVKPGKSRCRPGEEAVQGVLPALPRHGRASLHLLGDVAGQGTSWHSLPGGKGGLLPAAPATGWSCHLGTLPSRALSDGRGNAAGNTFFLLSVAS